MALSAELNGEFPSVGVVVALEEPNPSVEVWTVTIFARVGGIWVRVGDPIRTNPARIPLAGPRVVAVGYLPGADSWRAEAIGGTETGRRLFVQGTQVAPLSFVGTWNLDDPSANGEAGGGAQGNALLWNVTRGDAKTWPEVMAAVSGSTAPLTIFVDQRPGDPPLIIPAGTHQMNGARMQAVGFGDPSVNRVECSVGAVLRNMTAIGGSMTLVSVSNAAVWSNDSNNVGSAPAIYLVDFAAVLRNEGTAPMIDLPAAPDPLSFAVLGVLNAGLDSTGASIVRLGSGGTLLLVTRDGGDGITPVVVEGPVGATAIFRSDGSTAPPIYPLPLFFGTFYNYPIGFNGGGGPAALRPVGVFDPLPDGVQYYDREIAPGPGLPIWWWQGDLPPAQGWYDAAGGPR